MSNQRTLGIVGAGGLIVQIILGFALAGGTSLSILILPLHIVIGLGGLALVSYLVARVFYVAPGGIKFLYIITFLLVLVQVALGFRVLSVPDVQLVMSHEGDAFAVLILLGLAEMAYARERRRQRSGSSVKPSA